MRVENRSKDFCQRTLVTVRLTRQIPNIKLITIFLLLLFFIFIHNKGINIHMTYNNNENKQSEIITLSLYL